MQIKEKCIGKGEDDRVKICMLKKVLWGILATMLFLSGCGSPAVENSNETGEKQSAKAKIVRLEGGDYGLPQPYTTHSRGPGRYKVNLIFDKLIEKDEKGYIPWLAESWETSEDGREYHFKLQENVQWHDGEAFTAEDVAFTLEYAKTFKPVVSSAHLMDNEFVKEVEVLDTHQLRIILGEPSPIFIEELYSISIIPKHIWEGIEAPETFTEPESLVGTGPYRLTHYEQEHGTYRFEASDHFWGPNQKVDVIEFVPVSDPVLALQNGEIHLSDIPMDSLARFREDKMFQLVEKPGVWGYRLRFNMENRPELSNRSIRRAMAYAIDRESLVEKIARGAAIPGSMGILPPDHLWYHPNLPAYEYSVDQAMAKLAESEWQEGTLSFELLTGEDQEVRMGELIREQLEDVGMEITLRSMDSQSRDQIIADGQYELVLVGHGGWARDADYLRARFTDAEQNWVNSVPGYRNPQLMEKLQEQIGILDEAKRRDKVMEIQEMLAEEVPEIPLFLRTGYTVYHQDVYDGWMHVFDHHNMTHNKLSYLER